MKKRLILILVSIFSVLTFAFALTGCTTNIGNQDESKAQFVAGTTPFETLKTFVTAFPNRMSGSAFTSTASKEKEAAKWISQQFASMGYKTSYHVGEEDEGLSYFEYVTSNNTPALGYNVVYKKYGSSDKTVVIGANYDNYLDSLTYKSDGTYNNGVGVATLIELARVLKNTSLPFNIEFVAFGAKEQGYKGSQAYLENRVDNDNIVLMVNFDRNAIGDYVYMYSSEAKTKHNQFFYDIAREKQLCIADLPTYRSPSSQSVQTNSLYSNEANWADSQVFLINGINVVSFISMNFKSSGVIESERGDVAYTEKDKFDTIIEMFGDEAVAKQQIDKQINSAVSAVYYALLEQDFLEVMLSSKANAGLDSFASSIVMYIASAVLTVVAIISLIILYFVLKQVAKPHEVYVNTIYGRMNTKTGKIEPNNTNIPAQNKNNVGDIFGAEYESKQTDNSGINTNADSQNSGENTQSGSDKTTDIFGDF